MLLRIRAQRVPGVRQACGVQPGGMHHLPEMQHRQATDQGVRSWVLSRRTTR